MQESKLFDIANTLADVMICVPSLNTDTPFGLGPRDLIHALSALLGSFRGGNPAVTSILQDKLATLGLAIASPVRRLRDVEEEGEEEWGRAATGWGGGGWRGASLCRRCRRGFRSWGCEW